MKNRPFYVRMGFALNGIKACWRSESSFRAHVGMAAAAIAVMIYVQPAAIWWALIGVAITSVMAFELVNSAFERLIDHLHPDIHPEIGIVKDMASGAVLLTGVGAFVIAVSLLVTVV